VEVQVAMTEAVVVVRVVYLQVTLELPQVLLTS
jgi:hypothetical protein